MTRSAIISIMIFTTGTFQVQNRTVWRVWWLIVASIGKCLLWKHPWWLLLILAFVSFTNCIYYSSHSSHSISFTIIFTNREMTTKSQYPLQKTKWFAAYPLHPVRVSRFFWWTTHRSFNGSGGIDVFFYKIRRNLMIHISFRSKDAGEALLSSSRHNNLEKSRRFLVLGLDFFKGVV